MSTQTIQKELLDAERKYWQAIKDKQADVALSMTDDPCLVTGAQGVASIDKKTFEAMMRKSTYTLDDFELKDVHFRMLNEDVAVLAYKVHEVLTVDGNSVTLDAAESSTWVRRDGRWFCAAHSESIAGDPFGRARPASDRSPEPVVRD